MPLSAFTKASKSTPNHSHSSAFTITPSPKISWRPLRSWSPRTRTSKSETSAQVARRRTVVLVSNRILDNPATEDNLYQQNALTVSQPTTGTCGQNNSIECLLDELRPVAVGLNSLILTDLCRGISPLCTKEKACISAMVEDLLQHGKHFSLGHNFSSSSRFEYLHQRPHDFYTSPDYDLKWMLLCFAAAASHFAAISR